MGYETSCQRRAMGEGRPAVTAGAEAREEGRSPAGVASSRADRHLVRAAHGTALAAVALGAGLRERLNLLATLPHVDAARGVATPPPGLARRVELGGRDRLEPGRLTPANVHRGIQHRIARRGIESKERLGRHRWVIERTFAWLNKQRRLMIRFDRRASHYVGFLHLGCALICWNFLSRL